MKLSSEQLIQLSQIAITAATEAGLLIASYADKEKGTQHKAGGESLASQIVTEVDLKSQEIILKQIQPTCSTYDLALLTEESPDDQQRLEKDYFWCIDPLDGTLPFVEGVPGYAVSIALVSCSGIPQLGIIYDPLTQTLYHAIHGQGAFRNNLAWKITASDSSAERALTFYTDRSFLTDPLFDQAMTALKTIAQNIGCQTMNIVQQGGGAMNAIWILEKSPACYFKFPKPKKGGGSLWDYAATACIAAEVGFPASDIFGNPLDLNRKDSTFMNHKGILYASDPTLSRHIVEMYRDLTR
jgi:myo-inositol-1(or 4)-monophosphatase